MLGFLREFLRHEDVAAYLTGWVLVMARVAPLALFCPWLGARAVPLVARTSLSAALAIALTPLAAASTASPPQSPALLEPMQIFREFLVGTSYVLATALPFFILETAGRYVDSLRSGGPADQTSVNDWMGSTSPLGQFYGLAAVAVFFAIGGHRTLISGLADGIRLFPIGSHGFPTHDTLLFLLRWSTHAMSLSIQLVLPILASVILLDVAFGVLHRAAPQIPVLHVGVPLRSGLALFVAVLSIRYVFETLPDWIRTGQRIFL